MSYFTHCMLFLFYLFISKSGRIRFPCFKCNKFNPSESHRNEKRICPYYILEIEYMETWKSIRQSKMIKCYLNNKILKPPPPPKFRIQTNPNETNNTDCHKKMENK